MMNLDSYRFKHRFASVCSLGGAGGVFFHAFHGPEHMVCLLLAGLVGVVGFLGLGLLSGRKKCCAFHEGDLHNKVESPDLR